MKTDEQYIKDLYGTNLESQKQLYQDNYGKAQENLNQQGQQVQDQTKDYLVRTEVEAQQAQAQQKQNDALSAGAKQQAALSQKNTQQKNTTTLEGQKQQAEAEIERQRQLLGQQYATAIQQAQARNDMEQAQALYEQAKLEEQNFIALKQQAGQFMAGKGDYSILEGLYGINGKQLTGSVGEVPQTGALRVDEESYLRDIYGAKQQAEEAELQAQYNQKVSDLEAERLARQRQTDEALNEAYTASARAARNQNEMMMANGMGSGTMAQTQIARGNELAEDLTELRRLQLDQDAATSGQGSEYYRQLMDSIAASRQDNDSNLAAELYGARQADRQQNLELQLEAAQLMAQRGDYSLLGQIYGLTPEQVAKLQKKKASRPAQDPDDENNETDPTQQRGDQNATYQQNVADARQAYLRGEITAEELQEAINRFRNDRNMAG